MSFEEFFVKTTNEKLEAWRNEVPTEDEFIHKAKEQVNTFHTELYDLTIRLNMSLCAPLTSAGEDLLNALGKLELLKQSL